MATDTAPVKATPEQEKLARIWAKAHDTMVAGVNAENAKELRQEETKTRRAMWDAANHDRDLFDSLLMLVGKPVPKRDDGPPSIPAPRQTRDGGTKEPYFPKKDWKPEVGQQIKIRLYDPDDYDTGVIVGADKYDRIIVFVDRLKARRITNRSRAYPVRNEAGVIQTTDVATLPESARTPTASEARFLAKPAETSTNGATESKAAAPAPAATK